MWHVEIWIDIRTFRKSGQGSSLSRTGENIPAGSKIRIGNINLELEKLVYDHKDKMAVPFEWDRTDDEVVIGYLLLEELIAASPTSYRLDITDRL